MPHHRLTYNPSTYNSAQRFGEPWIDQRTQNNIRFTFSGKERDEETGYNYFGARYYNSDISIWLSVDPLSDQAPGWTPYRYGFNNPIQFVDPNGMFETKAEAKEWAKNNGIRTGFFSRNNIERGSDGSYSVNDMKSGFSYSRSDEQFPSSIEGGGFSELIGRGADGVNWQPICSATKNSWVDNVQTGLDIAGIADPTGILDGVNALIYATRGQWGDAGISALAIIPLIGDAGKAGRLTGKAIQLSDTKRALKEVHEIMGGSLPKGKAGKYGSPQRGNSVKGYRLDPAHPGRPNGHNESVPHINYWDYTNGKRGKGGIDGAIPIIRP